MKDEYRFLKFQMFKCFQAFALTNQLNLADKFYNAVALAQSPVVKALLNFDDGGKEVFIFGISGLC